MKNRFGFDWSPEKGMRIKGTRFWMRPQLSRRMLFRHAASAVGGYFLLPSRPMETIAKAAPRTIGTAKNVIFVLLAGAPSHVDTFDLKEGAWTPSFLAPTPYGDLRWPQGLMPTLGGTIADVALVRSARAGRPSTSWRRRGCRSDVIPSPDWRKSHLISARLYHWSWERRSSNCCRHSCH